MTAGIASRFLMASLVVFSMTGAAAWSAHAATPSRESLTSAWKGGKGKPHIMRPLRSSVHSQAPSSARSAAPVPPLTNGVGQLQYEGGFIQGQPRVYIDFWGMAWQTGFTDSAGYANTQAQTYVETFLNDLPGSAWFNSQTQYCEGAPIGATSCPGNTLHVGTPGSVPPAQIWNDTATTPVPTDPGIAGEADVAARHFNLQSDVEATVFVLTPTGQSYFTSGGVNFCAYHTWTSNVIYAYIPWLPDAPTNSCASNAVNSNDSFGHGHFDGFSIALGHELAEAATDPLPGLVASGQRTFGWVDGSGLESGDKCVQLTTWPWKNVAFGGGNNFFAVQPLWTDAGATCAMEDIGGLSTAHAAAASWDASRRDVFVRGSDGSVWHARWNGSGWSGWEPLGGTIVSGPAVASWGPNRLDVFVRGTDNSLWHKAWDGSSWSGWESLGGGLSSDVSAVSWGFNRLDVFGRGGDSAMWHKAWTGSAWTAWSSLEGLWPTDPASVSPPSSGVVEHYMVGFGSTLERLVPGL